MISEEDWNKLKASEQYHMYADLKEEVAEVKQKVEGILTTLRANQLC